ncbi:MAG: GNAT family N-acetyltransferase [Anaerolineales bacterium]|nr:GNAT family N-acetyltransferase [Anaerolineales bacterium]
MPITDLFQGPHLRLRAFEASDLAPFGDYLNHPDLAGRRYLPWQFPEELPLSRQQLQAILEKWGQAEKRLHLAVTRQEDGSLIGHASGDWGWDTHCPNIDLVIAPAYQQMGYGSEVLTILIAYFFLNTPAHVVSSSGIASWNQPAVAFVRKHGFTATGMMRRAGLRQGAEYDWLGFDLLRSEWLAQQGAA